MTTILRIGTRKSLLAMAQSQQVADALCARHEGLKVELVPIITGGDRYFGPLHEVGGKGLFTADLEAALRRGEIDLAVHSAKDLPAAMAADLAIFAVPAREDARDVLVFRGARSLVGGRAIGPELHRHEFGDPALPAVRILAAAREYAKANFAGKRFRNDQSGREWLVSVRGIDHTLRTTRNPLVAASMKVLPDLIKNAWFASSASDLRCRETVESVDTYISPLTIEGDRYDAVIRVLRVRGGQIQQVDAIEVYSHHKISKKGIDSPNPMGRHVDLPGAGTNASIDIIGATTVQVKSFGGEFGYDLLSSGAKVGTSSPRRGAQVRAMRPDVEIVPIRGNLETRLRKALDEHAVDATVLAMAGLVRAGLLERFRQHVRPLEVDQFVPAAGQGALAVQGTVGNLRARELAAAIDHQPSRQALEAERLVVQHLDADCRSSLAVHFRPSADGWTATLWASRPDGRDPYRRDLRAKDAQTAARELMRLSDSDGVTALLRE